MDKFEVLGEKLVALEAEYPEIEWMDHLWAANFKNQQLRLKDILKSINDDSIRKSLHKAFYTTDSPYFLGFELDYDDRHILTPLGYMLTHLRFCGAWAINISKGKYEGKGATAALMFAYHAFFEFGDEPLIRMYFNELMQHIPPSEQWGWPDAYDFSYAEENRQIHWLAYEIVEELKTFERYFKFLNPAMVAYLTAAPEKPDFKDFRAIWNQVKAAAMSEGTCKRIIG